MSHSPLKRIFLPSVLVSTAVFSTLTFTFVLQKPNVAVTELRPSESRLIQMMSDDYKSSVIRYVGFTIIASVGSGVATAEILRKWQTVKETLQSKKRSSILERSARDQAEPFGAPEVEQKTEFLCHPLELEAADQPNLGEFSPEWAGLTAAEALEPTIDNAFELEVQLHLQSLHPSPDRGDQFPSLTCCGDDSNSTQMTDGLAKADDIDQQILTLHQHCQPCRITLPNSNSRQFAILLEGQYYRFAKLEADKNKTSKLAGHLKQQGKQVAITSTKTGYAVWALELDAALV